VTWDARRLPETRQEIALEFARKLPASLAAEFAPYVRELEQQIQPSLFDLIACVRLVAKRLGYAIAVHGSLSRDVDLVAVPWVGSACSAYQLAAEIIEAVNGYVNPRDESPVTRAHGRLAWGIHLIGYGTYLDLSVLPRNGAAEHPAEYQGA
jgi:hypothetical protein